MNSMLPFVFLSFVVLTDAYVGFTHSYLYDEYDVWNKPQIEVLPRICKTGCKVYVSLSKSSMDVAKKVTFIDQEHIVNISLYDVSQQFDTATTQKKPLIVKPTEKLTISNGNELVKDGETLGPLIIHIISNDAPSNMQYEVYEASNMYRPPSTGNIVTIMSADPFSVTAKRAKGNKVTAIGAGYDSINECVKVFELNDEMNFPGFEVNPRMPMLTFKFGMNNPMELHTKIENYDSLTFDQNNFIASPGFIGCDGMEVYRSSLYPTSVDYTAMADKNMTVVIYLTLNTYQDNLLHIKDNTNHNEYAVWGNKASKNSQQQLVMTTKDFTVWWTRKMTNSTFLIRITSSEVVSKNN